MPETTSLIDGYAPVAGCCDELFEADGEPRAHVASLIATLRRLGPEVLLDAGRRRDAIFMQQGITFEVSGSDGERRDRPFPLDLVPRVLTADEWSVIERGLSQRIRALNAFVDDVYHAHEIVRAGIVPWSLIVSRPSFARAVNGVRAPGGVYTHVCGCDLVRAGDGDWRVLEDNVRTPSGISYVLENRLAMTRLMPELFAGHRIRPVDHYPNLLLEALRAVAPGPEAEPTVVLWTPGPLNGAYFEHAFLAREMGIELVEASDLVVRDAVCYMRTTAGLQRVHTIYRRLDDDFIDPLEFRPDSMLGVPGLGRAYRAGTVAIANAIGTGVADDKAIYHYVPEMIRFYLDEEPILKNVPTYLLSDERALRWCWGGWPSWSSSRPRSRAARRVHRPTRERGRDRGAGAPDTGGAGALHRAGAGQPVDRPDRDRRRPAGAAPRRPAAVRRVRRRDQDRPRRADARRAEEGSMIVNSSQGGGSKDTWVLDDGALSDRPSGNVLHAREPPRCPTSATAAGRARPSSSSNSGAPRGRRRGAADRAPVRLMLARIAQELFWLGRDLTRAEHTARMLDGAFHADVAGRTGERGSR